MGGGRQFASDELRSREPRAASRCHSVLGIPLQYDFSVLDIPQYPSHVPKSLVFWVSLSVLNTSDSGIVIGTEVLSLICGISSVIEFNL